MKHILDAALRFRETRADDAARALLRVQEAERRRDMDAHAALDRAQREMDELASGGGSTVCLGNAVSQGGDPFRVLLPSDETWGGGHWTVTGATGSGKSYLALALIAQRIRCRVGGLVVIDMKGELAELLRRVVLPGLIASIGARDPELAIRTASRIAVLAPFDERAVPPFQVLARDRGLTIQEQAHEVASSFGRTIGRDLGIIQETVLRYTLQLAIDTGYALPDIAKLLVDDDERRRALERSQLEEVKHYFAVRFPRERGASIGALLSRLDSLTMYPGLRRMLSAKGMVRLPALIEDAITVIDLGGAPAGMREVPQFLGQLFFQKLVRAIFARRRIPNGRTAPVTIIADEFQELLSPDVARDFERVLSLARSQRCYLWLLFQQAAQVEATSPTLLRLLRTNTNYQAIFRASIEDARHFSHVLPVTGHQSRDAGGFPDPRRGDRTLTAEEERRELVELVPRMPDRLYWFWNPRAGYPALLVKSPHLDIPGMRQLADTLPGELREEIERGVVALEPETHAERSAPAPAPAQGALEDGPRAVTPPDEPTHEPLPERPPGELPGTGRRGRRLRLG